MFWNNKKSEFKKKQLNELQKLLWLTQMKQLIERDLFDEMRVAKEKMESQIRMEDNLIKTLEKSTKYEDRMKRNEVVERKKKIEEALKEQEKQMDICQKKIEDWEAKEVQHAREIATIKEKF